MNKNEKHKRGIWNTSLPILLSGYNASVLSEEKHETKRNCKKFCRTRAA